MKERERLAHIQDQIHYHFSRTEILEAALRHSSYIHEHDMSYAMCNERLEFLGDAVLELITSRRLFELYPDEAEGKLTTMRAGLVCERALASDAESIGLGEALELGKGEDKMGGRGKPSILCDAMEAVIGAIYLDGGMESAEAFVDAFVIGDLGVKSLGPGGKSELQELIQASGRADLFYETVPTGSDDESTAYSSEVYSGKELLGRGTGRNKKAAEQQAAEQALERLKEQA